jgi:hypothetical protein
VFPKELRLEISSEAMHHSILVDHESQLAVPLVAAPSDTTCARTCHHTRLVACAREERVRVIESEARLRVGELREVVQLYHVGSFEFVHLIVKFDIVP